MADDRLKVTQAAEKLVSRGRIQAAIDQYRKVLDQHPSDTSTLNRVGDLYVRLNRLQKAIDLFRQTAENFGRQGFFVKAIAIYKKIIRLDPGQIRAYEALAELYNRQGLTGDSLAQYQVVADYYLKHEEIDSAIGVYQNMIEIEPDNPTRRLQLAGILQQEGQTSQALNQYYEIASLMLVHSRGDDALRVLSGALDVDAGDLDFVHKATNVLREAGFDRLAEQFLDTAVEVNPLANAVRLNLVAPAAAVPPDPEEVVEEAPTEAPEEVESGDLDAAVPAEALETVEAAADDGADESVLELELDLADVGSEFLLEDAQSAAVEEGEEEASAVAGEQAAPEPQVVEEDDIGFELDVDEVSAELAQMSEGSEQIAPETEDVATEESAAAVTARPVREVSAESVKLLIEAEVLARYGMDEMAIAVLDRVLVAEPEHSEAMARLVRLQLKANRTDEALAVANRLADLVTRDGAPDAWDALCEAMSDRGLSLVEGRFVSETAMAPADSAEPEVVAEPGIEDLVVDADPEDEQTRKVLSIEEIVAETAKLARPRPGGDAESADDVLAEVIDEIERDSGEPKTKGIEESPLPAASVEAAAEAEPGKGLDWMHELEQVEAASRPADPREVRREDFVDLATELEAELIEEGDLEDELLPSSGEQSLEEIVEGFRQGMAESLSEEDFDTHYNLGVAYREMQLIDEAIGEFQLAAKDPRYLVECCSLLAACFVDKSFYDLAVQWYARGLESPAIDEESRLGLLYEMGSLLAATGEPEAARERFLELYGINSNYRDVVAKLEELNP